MLGAGDCGPHGMMFQRSLDNPLESHPSVVIQPLRQRSQTASKSEQLRERVSGCCPFAAEVEWPVQPGGGGGAVPEEVAGEADVLPCQRRGVGEEFGRSGLSLGGAAGRTARPKPSRLASLRRSATRCRSDRDRVKSRARSSASCGTPRRAWRSSSVRICRRFKVSSVHKTLIMVADGGCLGDVVCGRVGGHTRRRTVRVQRTTVWGRDDRHSGLCPRLHR